MSTVLITGASRGLGLEFAKQYATDGATIIACCRMPAKAKELQALAKAHKNIQIEKLDVNEAKSIKALAKKLKSKAIDILINNAGVISGDKKRAPVSAQANGQSLGSIDAKAWLTVLKTNAIAPLMVLEAFLPQILQGKERKVVNITSRMGSINDMGTGYIAYRTSKAALNAAMANISLDLTAKKIAWVNLHPGWVKTDMGGQGADITPPVSVTGMRAVIGRLTLKTTGQFLGYDGKVIPW
ncbi:MAG: SDR family oxidoreductase [Pseudomonadota bacterium]|nr:SDR family oxidoreductase [Pseudomonadota bacterium]